VGLGQSDQPPSRANRSMLGWRGMPDPFSPRLDILPEPQRRLWSEFAAVPRSFVLYGGTALALHLGHRQSADFDFFGRRRLDGRALLESLPFLGDAAVTRLEPDTMEVMVDRDGPVKLSFFAVPRLPRLAPPHVAPDTGVQVASLLDLAGTKANVVQLRAESKDYEDIDAILKDGRVDLPTALACARALYGPRLNPQNILKALCYFDDGGLRRLPKAVRDRLAAAVRAVDLDQLPAIPPAGRTRRRTQR
jgi:Nucleotidyl transferase AbiEii toxin, Type IV TA system